MRKAQIVYNEYSTEELLEMPRDEAVGKLTEMQQRFCEAYVSSHNIKMALIKAGYKEDTVLGYMIRKKPAAKRYIQWLKARIVNEAIISGAEIIEQWLKIAFADMSDFVDIHKYSISLKPADQIDGQLIKTIKSGKDGVSVELYDKLKALDSLAKYTEDMPKDYRQIIEEKKLELMQQEFELKKKVYDMDSVEKEDDGFIEALSKSAKVIWEDEE